MNTTDTTNDGRPALRLTHTPGYLHRVTEQCGERELLLFSSRLERFNVGADVLVSTLTDGTDPQLLAAISPLGVTDWEMGPADDLADVRATADDVATLAAWLRDFADVTDWARAAYPAAQWPGR